MYNPYLMTAVNQETRETVRFELSDRKDVSVRQQCRATAVLMGIRASELVVVYNALNQPIFEVSYQNPFEGIVAKPVETPIFLS